MKRVLAGLCATFSVLSSMVMSAPSPERVVQDNRLISRADPALSIEVPASAKYLGAERWDLYEVADCELHLFVEADSRKVVKSLYWIQFEGFLPTNTHTYDYTKDEPVTFGGLPFWKRARFGPSGETPRTGSDTERVRQMLERAGYELPPHTMNLRLVHLLDDSRRKELMLIYGEDLGAQGYTSDQLMDGDKPRPAWDEIEQGLVERARQRIRISLP